MAPKPEKERVQIIDVQQWVVVFQNPGVQRPGMTVDALHRHPSQYAEVVLQDKKTVEEFIKAALSMLTGTRHYIKGRAARTATMEAVLW